MSASLIIYGKDTCPYTTKARKDFEERGIAFDYIDVQKDAAALTRLLQLTDGYRQVPVIVDGDKVTIGYGGT